MAEADMELDLAPHITPGEQTDEDLIDYDEDDLERNGEGADHDVPMDFDKLENAGDHDGQDEDGMDILDYQEQDTIINDSDHDGAKESFATLQQSNELYTSDEQHETPEIEIPDRVEQDGDDVHEHMNEGDSLAHAQAVELNNEITEGISFEDTTEPAGNVNFDASDGHAPEGGEGPKSAELAKGQPEDDEITWEDEPEGDGDKVHPAIYKQENADEETNAAGPDPVSSTRPTDEGHVTEQEQKTLSQTTEHDPDENAVSKAESQYGLSAEVVGTADQDQSREKAEEHSRPNSQPPTTTSQDSDHGSTYPSITVHYRGEDYPLFSATGDGFFSSLSLLDCSFQELLADFRVELDEETDTNNDLVLQIDELGLEFSEAHQNETLSACTLRQVLEIHELLVKNQDPDGSRCLYTYLTARPNPSKRYEYLVECATEGKGLDEIIHLFAPTGNATEEEGISEPNNGIEEATTTHTAIISHDDAEQSHLESEYYQAGSYEDLDEPKKDVDGSDTGFEAVGDTDIAYSAEAQANKDVVDNQQLEDAGKQDVEDTGDIDSGAAEEAEGVEEVDFGLDLDTANHKQRVAPEETKVPEGPGLEATDEFLRNGMPAAQLDSEADAQETQAQDFPGGAADAVNSAPQTTESSNSRILNESSEVDAVSPKSDGPGEDHSAEEDEFAEIDWRDEPEVVEVIEAMPSTGEKRGRDDEIVTADTEQDVKRRRP